MSRHRIGNDLTNYESGPRAEGPPEQSHRGKAGLLLFRIGLPAMLAVSGIVLLLAGSPSIGIVLIGTAAISALVDLFARHTNESGLEREREEQARRAFMQTGRWPRSRS